MIYLKKKSAFSTSATLIIFLLFLAGSTNVFSQGEAAIWYFGGNAGLDFNSGAPVALTNSALYTGEGCSTVSDANGNLLFYTNGVTVYNSSHQIMTNGDGLDGNNSSSQSAVIVRKPGSSTIYYIFTTNAPDGTYTLGLNFYEVDMSLSGGLGQVTLKNGLPLTTVPNPPLATPVAEKLTAVYHADGEKIWVISHRSNNSQDFIAYLVSSTGVNTTPVVSTVGMVYNYYFNPQGFLEENNLAGCLKASPDGTKLAAACHYSASMFVTTPTISPGVQLFDFDNETGTVSNARTLNSLKSYGIEFSPNSKILYATSSQNGNWNNLFQYNATLPTEAAIVASQTVITTQSGIGSLQLGMDRKLYAAKILGGTSLHVVNNPNELGTACNFQASAVSLNGRSCFNGLPNTLTSLFDESINFEGICAGLPTAFSVTPSSNIQTASWNFGDPDSGTANTSAAVAPEHIFSQAGTYTVTVTVVSTLGQSLQMSTEVTILAVPVANTPADLQVCTAQTTALFNISAQTAVILGTQAPAGFTVTYYTSQAAAEAGTDPITTDLSAYSSAGETIYARIQNIDSGCFATTQFDLIVLPQPAVNPVSALTACDTGATDGFSSFDLTVQNSVLLAGQTGVTVAYYTTQADAEAGTAVITAPQSFINTVNPQTIYVALTGTAGCKSFTSFTVNVFAVPTAAVVPALTACDTGTADGFTAFNLTTQDAALLAGQTGATVAYFTSQANAEANDNAITTPQAFVNTENPQTIYARISNANDCFVTTSFTLTVNPQPTAATATALETCDKNTADGFTAFDLTQQDTAILAGQANVSIAYFTSQANAEANTNPVTSPEDFTNTQNPQVIYARVSNANCFAVTSFSLNVLSVPVLASDMAITGCPPFDVTTAVQPESGIIYSYYANEEDANEATNAITAPTAYTPSGKNSILYVRAENAQGCTAIAEVTVVTGNCNIQKGISPNNDGKNDAFDLTAFDVNKLSIFNRYGLEVYSYSNYTSQWHGQQDNGNELPTGTYFYMIQNNSGEKKTGWVYVNREIN